jgi:hypothetical protein
MKNFVRIFYDYGAGGGGISYNTPANTAGANLANNGLSVSGGKVQLGGLSGSAAAATLLNNREIPLNGFSLLFSGIGTANAALILRQSVSLTLTPQIRFQDAGGTEIGYIALPDNLMIAIGSNAGAGYTTKGANGSVLIGIQAGHDITTPNAVIAIGSGAVQGTGAVALSFVIGIGNDVLDRNGASIGQRVIVIGDNSAAGGAGKTIGNNVTIVGSSSCGPGTNSDSIGNFVSIFGSTTNVGGSLTNSTIIGCLQNGSTFFTLSNCILLGNSTQNTLIGQANGAWSDNGSRLQITGSISLPIVSTAVNLTVDATMNAIVATASVTLTMPTVAAAVNRDYYLVAQAAAVITTSVNYTNLAGASVNTVPAGTAVKIRSNGTIYIQIR